MAEKVTDRLFKVTDAAGKERLVRGVDAAEIEAVAASEETEETRANDLIAQADRMLDEQKKEAKREAKGPETEEPTVEGVTTTPKTLLKSNEPEEPRNEAMFRESQNNPPRYESDTEAAKEAEAESEPVTLESLTAKSRTDLEREAKGLKIDGSGYPNKESLAKAILKARK